MAGAPNNSETAQYPDLVIVGAGLFGLTVAQQAVEHTVPACTSSISAITSAATLLIHG